MWCKVFISETSPATKMIGTTIGSVSNFMNKRIIESIVIFQKIKLSVPIVGSISYFLVYFYWMGGMYCIYIHIVYIICVVYKDMCIYIK